MNQHLWIAAVFVLVGLALAGLAVARLMECLRSLSWPSVEATVISSTVEKEYNDGIYYPVKLSYRYAVNGRTFIGNRIRVGGEVVHTWAWPARRRATRYPAGAIVRAYHSPQDPANAVLEPGFGVSVLGVVAAAGVLLIAAWNQFLVSWSQ